jgi:hypothetical protein
MTSARGQSIEDKCKIIYGNECDYDISFETDDYIDYMCYVRKDFGDRLGPLLTMVWGCPSKEAAAVALERQLDYGVQQIRREALVKKK